MTSSNYYYEDDWPDEEWPAALLAESLTSRGSFPVELAVIVGALLVATFLGWGALGLVRQSSEMVLSQPNNQVGQREERINPQPISPPLPDDATIIAPYESYIVTQAVHGLSYGHMAIDIAAGKGEPIKSPISGVVTENFIDDIGNPTLVIENDRYAVTLLHGIYSVQVRDVVAIGDQIGVESNIGNTRDMQGQSCRNRDCGYHTHINVFDKDAEANINPLTLFRN